MSLCFSSYNEAYQTMFTEYKDIVSVKEASIMLNTGRKQIYKLLKQGKLDKLEHNAKGFFNHKAFHCGLCFKHFTRGICVSYTACFQAAYML